MARQMIRSRSLTYTLQSKLPFPLHPFDMVGIYTINVHDLWSVVLSTSSNRKEDIKNKKLSLFIPKNEPWRQSKEYKHDTVREYCITGGCKVRDPAQYNPKKRLLVARVSTHFFHFNVFTFLALLVDPLQAIIFQLDVFSAIGLIRFRERHLERAVGARRTRPRG